MTQVAIALVGTPLTHPLINDGTAPDVDKRILPKGYEILQSRQANKKKHMTGSIADVEKKAALDAMYAEKQGVKDQMQADANKLKRKMD